MLFLSSDLHFWRCHHSHQAGVAFKRLKFSTSHLLSSPRNEISLIIYSPLCRWGISPGVSKLADVSISDGPWMHLNRRYQETFRLKTECTVDDLVSNIYQIWMLGLGDTWMISHHQYRGKLCFFCCFIMSEDRSLMSSIVPTHPSIGIVATR